MTETKNPESQPHKTVDDSAIQSIGERIRLARKDKSLNQAELALRLGVSQPAVANWESGVHDPRRLMLARLAEALGVSLDWLAGGARSSVENDRHPAAAYLRRQIHHAPVIAFENALRFLDNPADDPHSYAEDYIPVTLGSNRIFAVFVDDNTMDAVFDPGALVVVDYADRAPVDGGLCLAECDGRAVLRRWRTSPPRLETNSKGGKPVSTPTDPRALIGCVRVSIRVH
ncbi:MAG: helix-turn-helix domain-containing protein [Pseudomonadota bacterium]